MHSYMASDIIYMFPDDQNFLGKITMENGVRDSSTVIKHYLEDIELLENIHRRFRKIVKVLAGNMFEN